MGFFPDSMIRGPGKGKFLLNDSDVVAALKIIAVWEQLFSDGSEGGYFIKYFILYVFCKNI